MISLIALAIAFLTLLVPSQADTRQAEGKSHAVGQPAMWAESDGPFSPLLGDWIATVALPEGDLERTQLTIESADESSPGLRDSAVTLSMGQGDERFSGPLAAHLDGEEVVFAGTATCPMAELGSATISGRRVGDRLTGSAYLPELQRLVTFTARRTRPSGKSASWWS